MANVADFLTSVITTPEGWFCLSLGESGKWWEEWFRWPADLEAIVARVEENQNRNVFFSAHLFAERSSRRSQVLPTRTIQADLDGADVSSLPIPPTVLVKTSDKRYQGYWILNESSPPSTEILEILSRKLTYSIEKCDRSGWTLGHRLRVAPSYNWKYPTGPQAVVVVSSTERHWSVSDLEVLPDPGGLAELYVPFEEWVLPDLGPNEIIEKYRSKLPTDVIGQYLVPSSDRSVALWRLECACFRAGMTREEAFIVARGSASNKFKDLRHNSDLELSKDILRAEVAVRAQESDTRSVVMAAKKLSGMNLSERREHIFGIVWAAMRHDGAFWKLSDESIWYVPQDSGRPISVHARSEYLKAILYIRYGLNATEGEFAYVAESLMSSCLTLPPKGLRGVLSYYDQTKKHVLIHSGHKTVWKITPTSIDVVSNGTEGVLFPWTLGVDPIVLSDDPLPQPWYELAFISTLESLVPEFPTREALTLLRVWFLFILFREAAASRPILGLLGQAGSGKSTMFRKLYYLLYGRSRELSGVTSPDDFDQVVTTLPLAVFDNVDTWERWLPDRLALAASNSDVLKRKLYTDSDQVILRRQALIGLTSHDPKFGREDVADRMLVLNFSRRATFRPEGQILDEIQACRSSMWKAILQDVQAVLNAKEPMAAEVPQFRIEDFARLGLWIARGLGPKEEALFKTAMNRLKTSQRHLALQGDEQLVDSLLSVLDMRDGAPPKWQTVSSLYDDLQAASLEPYKFVQKYRSPGSLGRKLWNVQDALKELVDIECSFDTARMTRIWKVSKKEDEA